jgi:hypothetical protein
LGILGITNVCFDVYEWPCSMCIQGLLLSLNGLHIMVTLGIYFEYIKFLCKIFNKFIDYLIIIIIIFNIIFD